ncbi:hypothetical protein Tco_1494825, partial [Tanacetum coccineum]
MQKEPDYSDRSKENNEGFIEVNKDKAQPVKDTTLKKDVNEPKVQKTSDKGGSDNGKNNRISALVSRLGKPLVMDSMTDEMMFGHVLNNCHKKEPIKTNMQKEPDCSDMSKENNEGFIEVKRKKKV